eukprot:132644-Pelagomonas_calceolata.AAC.9
MLFSNFRASCGNTGHLFASAPVRTPRFMSLNLSGHVLRTVSRFRLRAHTLCVDRAIWSRGAKSAICDRCNLHEDQDEAHVLFKVLHPEMCRVRQRYSELFQQKSNKLFHYTSEIMDFLLTGIDQSQTDQPNALAEEIAVQEKWAVIGVHQGKERPSS